MTLTLPVLSGGKIGGWQSPDWLGALEDHHWFLLSDIANIVRGLTSDMSLLTLVALLLVPLSFLILWRTPFGLRIRSCGEDPYAAESLGVQVYRMKYAAVVISGAFSGLVSVPRHRRRPALPGRPDQRPRLHRPRRHDLRQLASRRAHRGLAAVRDTDAMNVRGGGQSVHALLLFVALLLIGVAVWQALRAGRLRPHAATDLARREVRNAYLGAALALLSAVGLFAWFLLSEVVPGELVSFTPHLTTLLVLALASQRLRMPAANGLQYRRGEAR